jgi:hypothetical protein
MHASPLDVAESMPAPHGGRRGTAVKSRSRLAIAAECRFRRFFVESISLARYLLLNQRVPVCSASPSVAILRLPRPLLSLFSSYRLGTAALRHIRRVEALGSHSVILQRRGSRVSNCEPPTLVAAISFSSIPSFRTVHTRDTPAAYTASSRHAHPPDNGHPRTRQGLLQALSQRQRRHTLQDRLHRLPRAMAQQRLQTRRAHAAAQI